MAAAMIHGSRKRDEFPDLANVIHPMATVILFAIMRREQAILGLRNDLIHRVIHRSAQRRNPRQVVNRRSLQNLQYPGRISGHA